MYHLSIVTPTEVAFDDQIHSLMVPGVEGYMEILSHHMPVITNLKPGKIVIINKNHEKIFFDVSWGILEVAHNRATLLIEKIEEE